MDLAERLAEIQTRKLDLLNADDLIEADPHRPDIRIWADGSDLADSVPAGITVSVSALWAQPLRFIELSSHEARRFAQLLVEVADAFDEVVGK